MPVAAAAPDLLDGEYLPSNVLPWRLNRPVIAELDIADWLVYMQLNWQQGQHVALIGQTGSGKTSLAAELLLIRDWVVVLAVKRNDDTLDRFTDEFGYTKTDWPPQYDKKRVIYWARPKNLADIRKQAMKVYRVLDDIFQRGGYCVYCDDTGYMTGTLGLHRTLTVLLNQGRSSHISVVTAATQPTSVAARIPTETLRQVRHIVVFPYYSQTDLQAISKITGYDWRDLQFWTDQLGPHDFLAFTQSGPPLIVRNTREVA